MNAFLLGVDLDAYFTHASDCLDASFYFLDDTAYFSNNITLSGGIAEPTINFTKLLAGNFSESLLTCYQFSNNVFETQVTRIQEFGSIMKFIIAFMFN